MPTQQEQAAIDLILRWNVEAWSKGNLDLAHEIISPTMQVHGAGGQVVKMGPDGLIELIRTWRNAFPDGYMTVEDIFAEGDTVCVRNTWHGHQTGEFYGVPPSGNWVEIGSIGIDRVENGKIVEGWGEINMVSMMQQMGALPTPNSAG